jgi:hypothetical protein
MTEHPEGPPEQAAETGDETSTAKAKTATEAPPRDKHTGPGRRSLATRRTWRRMLESLATAVVVVAVAVAIILAVHIVFVVFEANGANGIVKTINDWAETLAWKFKDVFTPESPKTSALVNYGLAAVIYLIVGRGVAGLIRRAA